MTNLVDFDRTLGDFLTDGPNAAPEAPVIAAMAHARTTPRRHGALDGLRPDVMSRPRGANVALRSALLVAVLAVASIGVAVVGSPSPAPSVGPGPSSSGAADPFEASIPLKVAAGNPFTLTVLDPNGLVIGVESGSPGDGASVSAVTLEADPADDQVLVVTWTGMPCEDGAAMTIDGVARTISILSPRCSGDTVAFDRVARLRFSNPVRSEEWTATNALRPEATDPGTGPRASAATRSSFQPIGSPAVTPIRVILEDGVGDETWVDVVDESGRLVSAVAGPNTAEMSVEDFDAANDDVDTVRLSWPGRPCDTVHRLTIDAALTTLTLDLPQCRGDTIGVDRSLVLTFRDPVDALRLDTQLLPGRGGVDMPTWTAIGPDGADGTYRLRVHDPGYLVEGIEAYYDPERGSGGVGETGYRFDRVDASALRLVWLGPSCAEEFDLVLDGTGETWVLWSAPCATSTSVLRMFDASLTRPLDPSGFTFEARVGEPRG
jgi:hypothetical protein